MQFATHKTSKPPFAGKLTSQPQTSICPAFSKTYIQKKPHCRFNVTKLTLNQQCGFLSMILLQAAICHLTAFIMIELKQQILIL